MHYLQLLRVEADTEADIEDAVGRFLAGTTESDWWTVGGRWSEHLDGAAWWDLSTVDGDQVVDQLRWAAEARNSQMRYAAIHVFDVGALRVDDIPTFGLPVDVESSAAAEFTEAAAQQRDALVADLKTLTTTDDPFFEPQGHVHIAFHMQRLAQMLLGFWSLETVYYDTVEHTASFHPLLNALGDRTALKGQWLVVVDLHS